MSNFDPNQPQRQVVIVRAPKSMGVSVILAFFFGPLGLLYSTVPGGLIMLAVSVVVAILTVGFGLIVTWPICIIWAVVATNAYNKALLSGAV